MFRRSLDEADQEFSNKFASFCIQINICIYIYTYIYIYMYCIDDQVCLEQQSIFMELFT